MEDQRIKQVEALKALKLQKIQEQKSIKWLFSKKHLKYWN